MKKQTKLFSLVLGIGASVLLLSSCTASFCSEEDKAQMMFAYDVYHVTEKDAEGNTKNVQYTYTKDGEEKSEDLLSFGITTYYETNVEGSQALAGSNFYVKRNIESNLAIVNINKTAVNNKIRVNDYTNFWARMDDEFLNLAIDKASEDGRAYNLGTMTYLDLKELLIGDGTSIKGYGYQRYVGENADGHQQFWTYWDAKYDLVRADLGVDNVPGTDYLTLYKNSMINYASSTVSCIATENGFYGYYGYDDANKMQVFISEKTYSYGWSKGFLEGLLIYPISWLIDKIGTGMSGLGDGWPQILAIFIVTFIIRAIMMALTIKQTTSSAKMQELSPEIAKIQAKYPNANTNKSEQQQLAAETQALYKKHKINPFMSIITMIVQFPVFICVWGAMNGSAFLSSGQFWHSGMRFNASVSTYVTNFNNWPHNPSWWAAAGLFLLMAGLQVVSMLLPQIIQKQKAKKVAKTSVNNNAKKNNNTMKWFTIIMMVMIIFMGFTLASGMVIYWIAGSLWAIAQTLIIELINYLKKNKGKNKNKGVKAKVSANGEAVEAEVVPDYMTANTGKKKKFDKGRE